MDIEVSVVIPIYNECQSIAQLYEEIVEVMDLLRKTYEIIIVDDGSTDRSFQIIKELIEKAKSKGVKLSSLRFRKNYGKSAALLAGFKEAKGDIIITMDGDLQDDPGEIPNFIEKIYEGNDLISGWKFNRRDAANKVIPSKIFNAVTSWLTGIKLHDLNCCFKAYRREVIDDLNIYGELHRFIPILVFYNGFKIEEIKVNHRPRKYGKSKYGFKRFFEGFFDLMTVFFLTRFIKKPLHFFGNFGLISSFFGFLIISFLYIRKFVFGIIIGRNPFLFFLGLLLIIVGFQFFSIGLLGELMIRINPDESKRYYIKEVIRT